LSAPAFQLTRHRPFVLFWCARTATTIAYQMQAVAIGWQIYDLTGSAFDLGLVGLVQFFPVVAMALVIGQIADRYDRRRIAGACQVVKALAAIVLAVGSLQGWLTREAIFAILLVTGTARAFETPTMHAMIPAVVPPEILPRAVAASTTAFQTAIIGGPALGGFMYLLGPAAVYATCAVAFVTAAILLALVQAAPRVLNKKPVTLESLFGGISYLRSNRILLGVISLDLFAMLLGGVTALLPIFAKDILGTGPWGLGLLRSAPAVGALLMSIALTRFAFDRKAGVILFGATVIFGISILVFALSTSLILSLGALTIYGAMDAVSVVIRHSLVQLRTPDDMLGRVMAVNSMFTGTTSTLGEFESGAVAAWLGVVPSALIGGVGAILIAAIWWRAFPEIARVDKLAPDP